MKTLSQETPLYKKKVMIVSYTHIVNGEHTTIGGPALALKGYLYNRVKNLVCIWQPLPISDTLSILVDEFKDGKIVRTFRLPIPNWPIGRKKPISFIYIILKLRDILSIFISILIFRTRFDIFVGAEALNASIGICLRRLGLVKKVIYYNFDYGTNRFTQPVLNALFHFLDTFAVSYADATWSLSETIVTERTKRMGAGKNGFQIVVPVGIDFYRIKRLPTEAIDKKRIVYLGVLMKQQGVQLLIGAFARVARQDLKAKLLIIGSGDFEADLRQMVNDYKIAERVEFTGIISDEEVEKLLCGSAMGIAPYVDDPFSNKRFTEPTKPKTYLGCGLPVIITRVPSIALDIEKEGAGVAINYDKDELASAINRFLSDERLLNEYRMNATRFASKYDWANIYDNAFKSSLDKLCA